MDSYVCYSVQPLPLPSAIHCLTATMPALTVTLSANALGSALGTSGVVDWKHQSLNMMRPLPDNLSKIVHQLRAGQLVFQLMFKG